MESSLAICSIVLVATVCWYICTLYIKIISTYFSKKILSSRDVNESCKYRKTFRLLLKLEKILYFALAIVGTIFIFEWITQDILNLKTPCTPDKYFSAPEFWLIVSLCEAFYFTLMLTNTSDSSMNKVSSLSINEVKKEYILFLRGFGCDNYLNSTLQEKANFKSLFSEHKFISRLSFFTRTYAVGRPEELINPSGADRIYLSNETWQRDVNQLMENAKGIVILVNDKPNCIWEIKQSAKMKSKTFYIINNKSKYLHVCQHSPFLIVKDANIEDIDHFYLFYDPEGNLKCKPFKNSGNSYWDIIKDFRAALNI